MSETCVFLGQCEKLVADVEGYDAQASNMLLKAIPDNPDELPEFDAFDQPATETAAGFVSAAEKLRADYGHATPLDGRCLTCPVRSLVSRPEA